MKGVLKQNPLKYDGSIFNLNTTDLFWIGPSYITRKVTGPVVKLFGIN